MAKNNNQYRMKGNQMYRRPTKAMQQNYMRNTTDMDMPSFPSKKRIIIQHIIVGVVVVGLTVLLMNLIHWSLCFLGILVIFAYLIWTGRQLNKKQKEVLKKYQEMGMTKKAFIRQMQARKIEEKQLNQVLRLWDSAYYGDKLKRTWTEKLTGI